MDTVTGVKDPKFQHALSLTRPAGRKAAGMYLAEGYKIVNEAIKTGRVERIFAVQPDAILLERSWAEYGVELTVISEGLLGRLVGTEYDTRVNSIAVVRQHTVTVADLVTEPVLLLAGERIQDPRNIGVLLRTAEAAGCAALLLSANSGDPWCRASVRSSTGSITRLPICLAADLPAALRELGAGGARIVATSAHAELDAFDADLGTRPLVILVGNESVGLHGECIATSNELVKLPMATGPSSLNVTVAAGILAYEAVRQAR